MRLIKNFIILACLCFFTGMAGQSQNIGEAINLFGDKHSPERVYLHYDKAGYSAGETIWFKAYLMNEFLPADKSKTLYVDWIDDKGNLLQHAVSPIVDAATNGQFDIPANYKGGHIQVRSYTKWMLNFDSAFLYNKFIRILTKTPAPPGSKNTVIPTINFFPEGGDAVAGISNKIAFKANDQWGRPVRVKGVIVSSQGKIIDSMKAMHDGMGYFYLTPEWGLSYSAKWKDDKGKEFTTALPAIKQTGVALQITLSGTTRSLGIRYSPEAASALDSLHVIGTMYQHKAFQITRSTNTPLIKASIPTLDLPSGILTITVFDKNWNPLAERITFINNEEWLLRAGMEVQHWGLNKRARNEIKITVPDSLGANLSVSITDAEIGRDSSNNIISHLLLSSELKGDVYKPYQFFSNRSDSVSQQLDLVMLTHGWRKFKWEEIVSGKHPKLKFERDTAYMTLSGKIYGVLPGQITPGTSIVLVVRNEKDGKFLLLPVNPDGSFIDPSFVFFDTAHVHYQVQKDKSFNNASVQFMTQRLPAPSLQPYASGSMYNFWPDTTGIYRQLALAGEAYELGEKMKVKTLENVILKSKTKSAVQLMDEKYASGLFQGDGYQFDLINDPMAGSAINIFTYLQGKVAGLQINTSGGTPSLQWRGGAPQLYLDEVNADPEFISSLSVQDVAYIKVFRPPFMGGFNGANGAIAIYTRRGNDTRSEPGKGLASNKVYGYTGIKEFYSPNYASFKSGNEQKDLRTTLYWNPALNASPQKKDVVIRFYNNDVSTAFRVVIEGMSRDGRLVHIEQIME